MTEERKPARKLPPSVELFLPDAKPQMPKERKTNVTLPALDQVCIVVKDVDTAIDYYGSVFGLGPFYVIEMPSEMKYRGQWSTCRLKLAFALSGDIEIELIQVLEGETPHTEYLREKGEGLFHLRFRVDDLDGTLAELAKEGIEPVWQDPGGTMAYLNSHNICGVRFELVQPGEPLSL